MMAMLLLLGSVGITVAQTVTVTNVIAVSGKTYTVGTLNVGQLVYTDRSYTFASVPASLQGVSYIRTANEDKDSAGSNTAFLSFDIAQAATVYVGHDDRITTKPAWLSTFADTGMDMTSTDGMTQWSLYRKDFTAGIVTLGGNNTSSGNSMYVVVIAPQTTTPPALALNPAYWLKVTVPLTGAIVQADLFIDTDTVPVQTQKARANTTLGPNIDMFWTQSTPIPAGTYRMRVKACTVAAVCAENAIAVTTQN